MYTHNKKCQRAIFAHFSAEKLLLQIPGTCAERRIDNIIRWSVEASSSLAYTYFSLWIVTKVSHI